MNKQLIEEFEKTGHTACTYSDIYPEDKMPTLAYTEWLEAQVTDLKSKLTQINNILDNQQPKPLEQTPKPKLNIKDVANEYKSYPTHYAIHCENKLQCRQIAELLHKLGFKWKSGGLYVSEQHWLEYPIGKQFCFIPTLGLHATHEYCVDQGYTIFKAKDFL